jgi:hypothetical protein
MAADDTFPETSGHGSRAGKRELAIVALLTSRTHADAAQACRISLRTLQRWLKEAPFAEAYKQAKSELVSGATTQLRINGTVAVATLESVATNKENPPAARVAAARAILEFMFQAHETEDISARLEKLELETANDEKF